MSFDLIAAFSTVLFILYIGDAISTKTKAFVPSVFVAAVLFLLGFWTILPENLIDLACLGQPLATLSMYLLLVHMGTLLNIKELAAQWRTVVISLGGIIGISLGTMTLGKYLFGWEAVVISTPPLTGGIVAALMMQNAAMEKGLVELSVLAIVMYVTQGFFGYPLTAIALKREGRRLLAAFRKGEIKAEIATSNGPSDAPQKRSKLQIIPEIPPKYRTTYMYLFKLGIVAWASAITATAINEVVSRFVICLIFGVIAAEIGFLERRPLDLSGSFGFMMTTLMAFIFAGLAKATPDMIVSLVGPLFGIIAIGVTGMALFSMVLGKLLGYSKEISFACALTALYGFPPNYVLTEEASKALSENPEEFKFLMDSLLPKMLVGGFTTVTIASVILAGIFVNLL